MMCKDCGSNRIRIVTQITIRIHNGSIGVADDFDNEYKKVINGITPSLDWEKQFFPEEEEAYEQIINYQAWDLFNETLCSLEGTQDMQLSVVRCAQCGARINQEGMLV